MKEKISITEQNRRKQNKQGNIKQSTGNKSEKRKQHILNRRKQNRM